MDIVEHYLSKKEHSDRTKVIAKEAYSELKRSRFDAFKVLAPATDFFAISSIRKRKPKEIALFSVLIFGGGMVTNELMAWNKLSGRLYITMKSDAQV